MSSQQGMNEERVHATAQSFSTYCFVIRSCLERDLHEHCGTIAEIMDQSRGELFSMYYRGVPAAAALLALEKRLGQEEQAW